MTLGRPLQPLQLSQEERETLERCGVHRSTRQLEEAIRHYIEATNRRSKPFVWTKTADEILASVGRFCTLISDSGH